MREYRSFRDFDDQGEGSLSLKHHLSEQLKTQKVIYSSNEEWEENSLVKQRFEDRFLFFVRTDLERKVKSRDSGGKSRASDPDTDTDTDTFVKNEGLRDAFSFVRTVSNWRGYWPRLICLTFYIAGFVLVGIVICQNILFVIQEVRGGG